MWPLRRGSFTTCPDVSDRNTTLRAASVWPRNTTALSISRAVDLMATTLINWGAVEISEGACEATSVCGVSSPTTASFTNGVSLDALHKIVGDAPPAT